ncbi:hypothetical protein ACFZAU_41360 [Streptomyces sp. NPDC008238]
MNVDLSPVIAATTQWLLCSYPPSGGLLGVSLAEAQARQAVTVATWLRYPTGADAALLAMIGPGGSGRLDWLVGADASYRHRTEEAWRSWVDEVAASWAACLLSSPALAEETVSQLSGCEHAAGLRFEFPRLLAPDAHDRRAASLLRHPDLLEPVAALHRTALVERLSPEWSAAA